MRVTLNAQNPALGSVPVAPIAAHDEIQTRRRLARACLRNRARPIRYRIDLRASWGRYRHGRGRKLLVAPAFSRSSVPFPLRSSYATRLPTAMGPTVFVLLSSIPLTVAIALGRQIPSVPQAANVTTMRMRTRRFCIERNPSLRGETIFVRVGSSDLRNWRHAAVFDAGFNAMVLMLTNHFGRVHGGAPNTTRALHRAICNRSSG